MKTATTAIRGVAYNWAGQACAFAITFVVTPIVIHALGNEAYGIWSLVMSLGAYYALSNLGLRTAGVKYISQFEAIDDRASVNKVVVAMLTAYLPMALLVVLGAAAAAFILPLVIEIKQIPTTTVRWVIVVSGFSVAVGVVGQVFAAILGAVRRFGWINALAVGTQLLQSVLIVIAVQIGWGLISMALIILIVMVLRQLCTYLLALRAVGYLSLHFGLFDWSMLRKLLGFGTLNVGVTASRRLINHGGNFIIAIILSPVFVTFYTIAQSLAEKLEDLGKGVNSVLMPTVSQLDALKRSQDLEDIFFLASRNLFAVALAVTAVFISLGKPLIEFWIGPEYAAVSYPVLCLLSIGMALRMPKHSAANVLKGTGGMASLARVAMLEAVMTLTLGVILVYWFGIFGMAVAVLATEIATAGTLLPLTCRIIGTPLPRYLKKACLPAIVAALPGAGLAIGMTTMYPPTNLALVVGQALIILSVTGIVILWTCVDASLRRDVIRSLRRHGSAARTPCEARDALETKQSVTAVTCPPEG